MFVAINLALSKFVTRPLPLRQSIQLLHLSAVDLRARKGTREKARKKKVKVEIKKVGFIPHNLRHKRHDSVDKHFDDAAKEISTDNAYPGQYYRLPLYRLTEAIQAHRETHDPTMYDSPNAPLNVLIEMNMQGEKKTKFVNSFEKLAMIQYPFDHKEDRHVLAFAKDEAQHAAALEAGAALAGGTELIKLIQKGDYSLRDYPYIVATANIMPELISLRGLLKRKFPDPRAGTLGLDIAELVRKHMTGVLYRAIRDEYQENYGSIKTTIGTLDMPTEHLVSNFNSVLLSVNSSRPKRDGKFVTRVQITSPPLEESFKIDPQDFPFELEYLKKAKNKPTEEKTAAEENDDNDDAKEDEAVTAKN